MEKEVKMIYYYRRGKTFYFKGVNPEEYPSKLSFTLELDDDAFQITFDEWLLKRGEIYTMTFNEQ